MRIPEPPKLPKEVERIVNAIPHGRENAISRSTLKILLGLSDRKIRRAISTARGYGVLILNDSSGQGYYIADEGDIEEISKYYWQERSRALSILYRLKNMRHILIAAGKDVA